MEGKQERLKKKTKQNDRLLENKLLQIRKNENALIGAPTWKSKVFPDLPVSSKADSPPLFFPRLHVKSKAKSHEASASKQPKFLLKQVERIQLPPTPKETANSRKERARKLEESYSAFYQPAINRNKVHPGVLLSHSDHCTSWMRKKKGNGYSSVRKKAIDEIKTIDDDIQSFIHGIRKDIKKSSTEILKEMESQRLSTRKQIAELRKMFSIDNKPSLSRYL